MCYDNLTAYGHITVCSITITYMPMCMYVLLCIFVLIHVCDSEFAIVYMCVCVHVHSYVQILLEHLRATDAQHKIHTNDNKAADGQTVRK